MGDVEDGHAQIFLQLFDFKTHFFAQVGIKVVQRLVQQQQAGLGHQGACKRHTLLLPARKLRGQAVFHAGKVHIVNALLHQGRSLGRVTPGYLERVAHILPHRHVGPHGIILKNHAKAALLWRQGRTALGIGHHFAAYAHAARIQGFKASHDAQQHCFAAARWPNKGKTLAVTHRERQILEHRMVAKGF